MKLEEKESIEINYWRDNEHESAQKFTKGNFLNKTQECRHLDYKFNQHQALIHGKQRILEIGAGQGWATCFLKRYFTPQAHVTVTDISPYAIESVRYWQSVFDVEVDEAYAAKSYAINAPARSYDLIFCYAAAHHFVKYRETLIELKRVLKSDGHILFLYEPTSSRMFYRLYYWYVNKMPHSTPEDVIVPSDMHMLAEELGMKCTVKYDPKQSIVRSLIIPVYFGVLSKLPFIQKFVPASADFIFTHKA